jgi:hypothetical protein
MSDSDYYDDCIEWNPEWDERTEPDTAVMRENQNDILVSLTKVECDLKQRSEDFIKFVKETVDVILKIT